MSRDPFIKPLLAQLYFLEGPAPAIKRVEAGSHIWSYRSETRAVIVAKRPRSFANCTIKDSRLIDYHQPDDYEPKAWSSWCNEKRPAVEVRITQLQAPQRLAAEVAIGSTDERDWKKAFTELGTCVLVARDGRRMMLSARTFRGVTRYAMGSAQ